MKNKNTWSEILESLKKIIVGEQIRVESKFAKKLLLEDTRIYCGAFHFSFYIISLGMGVYAIEKAPLTVLHNRMQKRK